MNLKMKKVIAWVLVCLCVFGSMPKEMVKAASSSTIYFVPKGQQGRYTDNLDEALQSLFWKKMYIMISQILFIMIQ